MDYKQNKMETVWYNSKSIEGVVRQARLLRFWIYKRNSVKWYTPEEFQHAFRNVPVDETESFFEDIIIGDPIEDFKLKQETLKTIAFEVYSLAKKIGDYYDPPANDNNSVSEDRA